MSKARDRLKKIGSGIKHGVGGVANKVKHGVGGVVDGIKQKLMIAGAVMLAIVILPKLL